VAAKTVRRNTTHMVTTAADRTSNTLADGSAPVTDSEIAGYAYALSLSRGGAHGHDMEDWLRAERALRDSARITTD
jgi:hypothetical protein